MNILLCVTYKIRNKMADNRLFSPPGVVAMGNALSSRMSRSNLYICNYLCIFPCDFLVILPLNPLFGQNWTCRLSKCGDTFSK